MVIWTLTLRAFYNLFLSLKKYLKPHMELFFNTITTQIGEVLLPLPPNSSSASPSSTHHNPHHGHPHHPPHSASSSPQSVHSPSGSSSSAAIPSHQSPLLSAASMMPASHEQQEMTLEVILDFCRDDFFMVDLYVNFDCDYRCSNVFENLCKFLYKVRDMLSLSFSISFFLPFLLIQ